MDEKHLARALAIDKKSAGRRTWRCLDDFELAAYADAGLDEAGRRRVETHLADCDFCLDQAAFLVRAREAELPATVPESLLARARELVSSQERVQRIPTLRWGLAAGVAASFALAAGLWLGQPDGVVPPPVTSAPPLIETVHPPPVPEARPTSVPAPTVRNRALPASLPDLLFPQEGSAIPLEELEFRWREVERSLFYEIRLVTADGSLVWEGRVETTRVRLPADLRLAAGQKYFVWVRAYLREGKTLKSSTVGFTVGENN